MTEVLLPGALPHIVAGLRVSAGFGWQSLIGAELIEQYRPLGGASWHDHHWARRRID
jgi:taurine transport system permease protein